jgi:hypothetical protein
MTLTGIYACQQKSNPSRDPVPLNVFSCRYLLGTRGTSCGWSTSRRPRARPLPSPSSSTRTSTSMLSRSFFHIFCLVFRLRIRIESGFNQVSESVCIQEGKNDPQKWKKKNFLVLKFLLFSFGG